MKPGRCVLARELRVKAPRQGERLSTDSDGMRPRPTVLDRDWTEIQGLKQRSPRASRAVRERPFLWQDQFAGGRRRERGACEATSRATRKASSLLSPTSARGRGRGSALPSCLPPWSERDQIISGGGAKQLALVLLLLSEGRGGHFRRLESGPERMANLLTIADELNELANKLVPSDGDE